MTSHKQFLQRHRTQLQAYLDDDTRIIENTENIISFIDSVLNDWDELEGKPLPNMSAEEMTFWFCLFTLESIAEILPEEPLMPFEDYMFDILREVRQQLRANQPLAEGYYATRPYFMSDIYDDDFEMTAGDEQLDARIMQPEDSLLLH